MCVVIAAWNAAATIGRAIDSALAEPEVAEVRVIDDASTDATAAVARRHDDGSGRLVVTTLASNAGPSAARNIAIADSRAPLLAILDADDFFLPGRFAALLAVPGWDLIADNIVFVDERDAADPDRAAIAAHRIVPRLLSAAAFVDGCITRRGRYKGELGFLKPVLSRAFLDAHGLRYAEEMRLSEDYDLYVRALIAGARFRLAAGCHYVAVERGDSLSSAHGERELAMAEAAAARLLGEAGDDRELRGALHRHHAQIARKRRHRTLLARKRVVGMVAALREQAREPAQLLGVLSDIARDKVDAVMPARRPAARERRRFLL